VTRPGLLNPEKCGADPAGAQGAGEVSEAEETLQLRPILDKSGIAAFMTKAWGSPRMMVGMHVFDVQEIEATGLFRENGTLVAFASWAARDKLGYLCALHAFEERKGYARQLLAALRPIMKEAGVQSVRAMVTNDNMPAMIFYQINGFRFRTLYAGGVDAYRPTMPGMRTHGYRGIPIHDALELECPL
jgi:GNAT superfamily N-acetyltransferase